MSKIITMVQKELAGNIIESLNDEERKAIIAFGADSYSKGLLDGSIKMYSAISVTGLIVIGIYVVNRRLRIER